MKPLAPILLLPKSSGLAISAIPEEVHFPDFCSSDLPHIADRRCCTTPRRYTGSSLATTTHHRTSGEHPAFPEGTQGFGRTRSIDGLREFRKKTKLNNQNQNDSLPAPDDKTPDEQYSDKSHNSPGKDGEPKTSNESPNPSPTPRQALIRAALYGWECDTDPGGWNSPVSRETVLAWAASHYSGLKADLELPLDDLISEGLFFEVHPGEFESSCYSCSYEPSFLHEIPEGLSHVGFWSDLWDANTSEFGDSWLGTGLCVNPIECVQLCSGGVCDFIDRDRICFRELALKWDIQIPFPELAEKALEEGTVHFYKRSILMIVSRDCSLSDLSAYDDTGIQWPLEKFDGIYRIFLHALHYPRLRLRAGDVMSIRRSGSEEVANYLVVECDDPLLHDLGQDIIYPEMPNFPVLLRLADSSPEQ